MCWVSSHFFCLELCLCMFRSLADTEETLSLLVMLRTSLFHGHLILNFLQTSDLFYRNDDKKPDLGRLVVHYCSCSWWHGITILIRRSPSCKFHSWWIATVGWLYMMSFDSIMNIKVWYFSFWKKRVFLLMSCTTLRLFCIFCLVLQEKDYYRITSVFSIVLGSCDLVLITQYYF